MTVNKHGGVCNVCGCWMPVCTCTPDRTQVSIFTPHTYTDIDTYPIHVTSKKQLKRECESRGLTAARLQ